MFIIAPSGCSVKNDTKMYAIRIIVDYQVTDTTQGTNTYPQDTTHVCPISQHQHITSSEKQQFDHNHSTEWRIMACLVCTMGVS